jgi:transposase
MVNGCTAADKADRFAAPPWNADSPEWQAINERLPADHLARRVADAVDRLDLSGLWQSYLGVGKKALPPDLLLKAVLYEMHSKRPSPAQWTKDARENEPLRWLLFGLEPSRAHWYDFRDRLVPFWDGWNADILQQAIREGMTTATRVAVDSSSVAANASRRTLLNDERLQPRQQVIDEHLQARQGGQPVANPAPGWLAKSEVGCASRSNAMPTRPK